jgi:60 kDa SS-A/Ro ribonucleoprotein
MRKDMFESAGIRTPETDTKNNAGGVAYAMTSRHELAQYATTGTFGDVYYVSAGDQLNRMKQLIPLVDSEFIAKLAVYAREQGYMKDMPAFLCGVLTARGNTDLLKKVFPRVINNGKMLRNYVQIVRSGVLGRKSLGTAPQRLVKEWIQTRRPSTIFRAAVGNNPSMADIIKMVHPTPQTKEEEALFGYLIGKRYAFEYLPEIVQQYESFKQGRTKEIPNVDFRYLTSLDLDDKVWKEIAKNAGWMMTRMNLNTFARHNVFQSKEMTNLIAERLSDREQVKQAKQFPFQMLTAYRATEQNNDIPWKVKEALQDAVDISMENIPSFEGMNIVLCPDTSGSMTYPITDQSQRGRIKNYDLIPTCIDVAGLVTSAFLRNNQDALVMPFATDVYDIDLNPRDTLTTNTKKIKNLGGGGTNCSLPMAELNKVNYKADLVIYISDYESWIDGGGNSGTRYGFYRGGSSTMEEWKTFKKRNPNAKLVCIDCVPNKTIQAPDKADSIINIGGFSDVVFDITKMFVEGTLSPDHWVGVIENIEI